MQGGVTQLADRNWRTLALPGSMPIELPFFNYVRRAKAGTRGLCIV